MWALQWLGVPCLFWLFLTLFMVWRMCKIREKEDELRNAMNDFQIVIEEHQREVTCAWERVKELSKFDTTRLCPICMDADAVTAHGEICGIACSNGHPLCHACASRLIRCERGVAHLKCPTCRCVSFIPVKALCHLINTTFHPVFYIET